MRREVTYIASRVEQSRSPSRPCRSVRGYDVAARPTSESCRPALSRATTVSLPGPPSGTSRPFSAFSRSFLRPEEAVVTGTAVEAIVSPEPRSAVVAEAARRTSGRHDRPSSSSSAPQAFAEARGHPESEITRPAANVWIAVLSAGFASCWIATRRSLELAVLAHAGGHRTVAVEAAEEVEEGFLYVCPDDFARQPLLIGRRA